jgi:threonine aldolase
MREAMAAAPVGDDGYGEDETVSELERLYAEIVGKPAAVFVPSGVMANQIAIRILTQPGDLIVAGKSQHLVSFELGAAARNSGVQFALVNDATGAFDLAEVQEALDAEADHHPHVSMVSVENTHMPSGGTPWEVTALEKLAASVGTRPIHMDGARLFNAVVATGTSADSYAAHATTVMTCLSKGLCAPVGSVLAGPSDLMQEARVERKRLGGAMRQAGIIAAAGLLGLRTMRERLADDHERARRLAVAVGERFPESNYDPTSCRTNIVAFEHERARELVTGLAALGVLGGTVAPTRVRFVTHADVHDDDVDFCIDVLGKFSWS